MGKKKHKADEIVDWLLHTNFLIEPSTMDAAGSSLWINMVQKNVGRISTPGVQ